MGNEGNLKPITAAPKFQLYNAETGELLGRTAGSWAKISLFYVAYFAFLAGLFTASIQIMKTSIDIEKPKLQTRLNIPGLHYFPKIDPNSADQQARLKENTQIPFFWDKDNTASREFYSNIVTAEKEIYATKAGAASSDEAVQNFDWTTMGSCNVSPYGWDTSEPCIFFRVNRVIDWAPVGLFMPEEGTLFATEKNQPTKEMQKDAVYIRCDSKYLGDLEPKPANLTFEYIGGDPSDGYITSDFFPYGGKVRQPNYQSPMVAVKVKGLENEQKHRVRCQAFAKNIVIDTRDNLGHIQFEIQHKGEATKTE